jgi:ADP-heptose:LPS heptosyltransferase
MASSSCADAFMPGLLKRLRPAPRKVALLRASRLGDFVCATPAFRSLRRALPEAELTLAALPAMAPLVARLPHLDRILLFPGAPGIAEQLFDQRRLAEFYRRGQAERFDLVIQMHGSGVFSNPVALQLRGKVTAGFVRLGDGPGGLDAAFPFPTGRHEVRKLIELCRFLGAEPAGEELEFRCFAEDLQTAHQLLSPAGPPLIGVHAGAEAATKRWSPRRFARAAASLSGSSGGTVVLLGAEAGGTEDPLLSGLAGHPVIDLRSRTSIPVLGAVISQLAVLLTNDSGPAHIAYATLALPRLLCLAALYRQNGAPPTLAGIVYWSTPSTVVLAISRLALLVMNACRKITVEEVVLAAHRALNAADSRPEGSMCSCDDSKTGNRQPFEVKKIAVLRANGIGDFLFSLPALAALRHAYPAGRDRPPGLGVALVLSCRPAVLGGPNHHRSQLPGGGCGPGWA